MPPHRHHRSLATRQARWHTQKFALKRSGTWWGFTSAHALSRLSRHSHRSRLHPADRDRDWDGYVEPIQRYEFAFDLDITQSPELQTVRDESNIVSNSDTDDADDGTRERETYHAGCTEIELEDQKTWFRGVWDSWWNLLGWVGP